MSKTIIIGDIHGRSQWKLPAYKEEWDTFIFIGDYFDSFYISAVEQIANFKDIIRFKEESEEKGKKVILLIGNHDFSYMDYRFKCAGFQKEYCHLITKIINDNKEHLTMCYRQGNYVMTHAGITKTWVKDCIERFQLDMDSNDIQHFINQCYNYAPRLFKFNGWDSYGDDIEQSCLWVRPSSLLKDKYGDFIQIVGHTAYNNITEKDGVIFIDVLNNVNEYLLIENNKHSIKSF